MKKAAATISFIFIPIFWLFAQQPQMHFKHLSNKDGLISNTVNTITQDSDGFMWFCTIDGLSRYDGYSFLNFIHSPNDSLSLSNNMVTCIAEDKNQNLWIGTRNGLNVLDRETYKIKRINKLWGDSIEMKEIISVYANDDKIWVGTYYSGLYCLNLNSNQIINYRHSSSDPNSISHNGVSCIIKYKNDELLIGTIDGLDIFDPNTSTFKHILRNVSIRNIAVHKDGSFLIGLFSNDHYFKWHNNSEIEKISLPFNVDNKIITPLIDSEGNQWVSVRDKGLIYYDEQTNETQRLLFNKYEPEGINSNAITSIYEDRSGNIWLGTHDAGLNIYKKKSKNFIHVKDNFLPNGLQNNRVRSMYQDSDGDIWIGTKVDGALSRLNRKTLTFTHYKHNPYDPLSISDDFIFSITEDRPGYLWVGTSNGLNLFNKKTEKFEAYFHDPDNQNSIASNTVYALLKDGDSLYIGGSLGLNILNTKSDSISHFHSTGDLTSISDTKVRVLFKDSDDNIWIGTIKGLNLFDRKTGHFNRFLNKPNDTTSISDNFIFCINEDSNQNLWVGTRLGVNVLDRKNNAFKNYTTFDGLAGNSAQGILEDSNGHIWISTNNGLSRFNPETETFTNYNEIDGLQANEFSAYTYCKTKNGEMLFGGNNGFNIFQPEEIKDNEVIPDILLTEFSLFNQLVSVSTPNSPLKKHISKTKEITLTHKQSVFSIEYVALNYTSTEKNRYAYIMEGFEDQWNNVGGKREATYTNLDSGKYVFRVKASNNDGYWNEEGVSLKINILPPPWKTWWAYFAYFILFMSMILVLWLYTIKRVKEEKEHEQNQHTLKFFVNVSHEFRTPISLILNPIEKLLTGKNPEDNERAISTIHQSAHKLANLVNQFLDFRKLDFGKLTLQVTEVNVVEFTQRVIAFYKELASTKDIAIILDCKSPNIQIWIDSDKFEKILSNLLSNAIKFSFVGGQIIVRINTKRIIKSNKFFKLFTRKKQIQVLELEVEDFGIGIQKEHVAKVFDRFYSSSNSDIGAGTGIGLNYAKELIELHNGSISVRSEYGKGTTFTVQLLLGKEHFNKVVFSKKDFNKNAVLTNKSDIESLRYELNTKDSLTHYNKNLKEIDLKDAEEAQNQLIYIVEDNKGLREQLKEELGELYKIKEAVNGADAWDKMQKTIPDLVLSDLMMPEMDGVELCQKIKTSAVFCHVPVVLLTAKTLVEHRIEGYKTGADDYISKPFDMLELKVRVKNILELRNAIKARFMQTNDLLNISEVAENNNDEVFMNKMVKIILENISDSEFSYNQLQEMVGMSRTSFYYKISSLTNMSPGHFINTIRIKHAAELLLKNQYTIKEIGYMCGFNSTSYFNRVFRKVLNKTPKEFKLKNS